MAMEGRGRILEDFGGDGWRVLLEERMEGGRRVKGWEDDGVGDLADVVFIDVNKPVG